MVRSVAMTLLTLLLAFTCARPAEAQVRSCHTCLGQGKTRCVMCQGTGRGKCYGCHGTGSLGYVQGRRLRCNVCSGMGFRMRGCYGCNGSGGRTCAMCLGRGRVGQPRHGGSTRRGYVPRRQPARPAGATITVGPYRFQGVFTSEALLQNQAGVVALAHWDKNTWRLITLRSTGRVGVRDFFKRDPVIANALKAYRRAHRGVRFGVAAIYTADARTQARVQTGVRAKLKVADAQFRAESEGAKPASRKSPGKRQPKRAAKRVAK